MKKYDMLEWNGSEWVLRGNLKGEQGEKGETGNGIASAMIDYAIGSDGTTIPTSDWSTTIPSVPQGQYLWTRTTTHYTDNTNSVAYSNAWQGVNGNGIISSKVDYQLSGSGTVVPDSGGFVGTMPGTSPGQFLWTRIVLAYTNGTNATFYSVVKSEVETTTKIPMIEVAPTQDSTTPNEIVLVFLQTLPQNLYKGYLYFITEE